MNLQSRKVILSAYLGHLDLAENMRRQRLLRSMLDDLNVPYMLGVGKYKGESEGSILAVIRSDEELQVLVNIAFTNFSQESILEVSCDNTSFLLYQDKEEYIGKWREVPENLAINKEAYSMFNDRYFIVR